MHYELEFGGGLGDVFYQMYYRGAYNVLRDLEPNDTARVALICHNPFALELFTQHPKANQISLLPLEYWVNKDDKLQRETHGLQPAGITNSQLPLKDAFIDFFPNEKDAAELTRTQGKPYLVLAAGAGLHYKNIPPPIVDEIIDVILKNTDLSIVVSGRNYLRTDGYGNARSEYQPKPHDRILNLVDKLTVPGTAKLLENSQGLITSHSALGMLGWLMQKPQFLLYPMSHFAQFIYPQPRTIWGFGIDFYRTVHSSFDHFQTAHCRDFINRLPQSRSHFEANCLAKNKSIYFGEGLLLSRILGDKLIYSPTEDTSISPHLAMSGFWESWVSVAIFNFLEPGMVAFDVGACFGYFTLLMQKTVGASGQVHAFEPDPTSFKLLQNTKVVNGLANTTLYPHAIGRSRGAATIHSKPSFRGSSTLHPMKGWVTSDTTIVPLDEFTQFEKVDFVKIDAEGWEEEIWAGSLQFLEQYKPTIVMEFSPIRYRDPGAFWDKIATYSKPHVVKWDGSIAAFSKEQMINDGTDQMLWLPSPK